MKRRICSLMLALALVLALLPTAAFAVVAGEGGKQYRDPVAVSTYAQLVAALPDGEGEPIANATLAADLTLHAGENVRTRGRLLSR